MKLAASEISIYFQNDKPAVDSIINGGGGGDTLHLPQTYSTFVLGILNYLNVMYLNMKTNLLCILFIILNY